MNVVPTSVRLVGAVCVWALGVLLVLCCCVHVRRRRLSDVLWAVLRGGGRHRFPGAAWRRTTTKIVGDGSMAAVLGACGDCST